MPSAQSRFVRRCAFFSGLLGSVSTGGHDQLWPPADNQPSRRSKHLMYHQVHHRPKYIDNHCITTEKSHRLWAVMKWRHTSQILCTSERGRVEDLSMFSLVAFHKVLFLAPFLLYYNSLLILLYPFRLEIHSWTQAWTSFPCSLHQPAGSPSTCVLVVVSLLVVSRPPELYHEQRAIHTKDLKGAFQYSMTSHCSVVISQTPSVWTGSLYHLVIASVEECRGRRGNLEHSHLRNQRHTDQWDYSMKEAILKAYVLFQEMKTTTRQDSRLWRPSCVAMTRAGVRSWASTLRQYKYFWI